MGKQTEDKKQARETITEEFAEKPKAPVFQNVARLVWRLVALLITIALVVGAVYLVVHRNEINVDSLRRRITRRNVEQIEPYLFRGDADSCVAVLDGGLVTCSKTELEQFTLDGEVLVEQLVRMNQPVLSVEGNYALAYDSAGEQLFVLHNDTVVHTYTGKGEQGILSARINENGWISVVEQATGYKAAVTVYDSSFSPRLTENVSSAYIMDAAVSDDNSTLALVAIGEDETGFETSILFFSLSDGEEIGRYLLGGDVALDLHWADNVLWVQGEYGTYCVEDHMLSGSYTDTTRYLQHYSLNGKGFAALYFTKYQGGNTGALTLLESDGSQSSIGVNEEVLSIDAAGNYVAVLTNGQLTIYRRDLTIYAQTESGGARRVVLCDDGAAMLISGNSVSVYIPD